MRPARWGSGFLRSGIHPGASPTVCFAAPPLAAFGFAKRSLRSHPRMNPSTQPSDVARGSRAAAELTLILLSGAALPLGLYAHKTVGASLLAKAALQPTNLLQTACAPIVGVSLLAMTASQPTNPQLPAPNSCGSWLASDDVLPANQSPTGFTQSHCGGQPCWR